MKTNQKLFATLATLAVAGAGVVSLANAQSITGTVSSGANSTTQSDFQRPQLTDAQKAILQQVQTLFKTGNATSAKALLTANGINFPMHGKGGMHGGMGNMKKIDDAIIAGNYASFKAIAVGSPLANIDETTFNQLTPQFKAKKSAEDQIKTILTNAGIKFGQK